MYNFDDFSLAEFILKIFRVLLLTKEGYHSHYVSMDSFTIGKSPDNQIVYDTEGISRNHIRAQIKDNQIYITDLGSANGTFINGIKTTALKEYIYTPFSEIKLGNENNIVLIESVNESEDSKYQGQVLLNQASAKLNDAKIEYNNMLNIAQREAQKLTEETNLQINSTKLKMQNLFNQKLQQAETQAGQILTTATSQQKKISIDGSNQINLLKQDAIKLQTYIKTLQQKGEISKNNLILVNNKVNQEKETIKSLSKSIQDEKDNLLEVQEELSDKKGALEKQRHKLNLSLDSLRAEIEVAKKNMSLEVEDEKFKLEDLKSDVYEMSKELIKKSESIEKFDDQMADINKKKEDAERIIKDVEIRKQRLSEELSKNKESFKKQDDELKRLETDLENIQEIHKKKLEESKNIKENSIKEAAETKVKAEEERNKLMKEANLYAEEKIKDADSYEKNKIKDADSYEKNKIQDADSYEKDKTQETDLQVQKKTHELELFSQAKSQEADNIYQKRIKETEEQTEKLIKDAKREIENKSTEAEDRINHSKETANKQIQDANHEIGEKTKQVQNYIKESEHLAKNKSEEIIKEGRSEYEKIIENANNESRRIIGEVWQEKEKLIAEINEITQSSNEAIEQTRVEEQAIRKKVTTIQDEIDFKRKENDEYIQQLNIKEREETQQYINDEIERLKQFKESELKNWEDIKIQEKNELNQLKDHENENLKQLRSEEIKRIENEVKQRNHKLQEEIEDKKLKLAEYELTESNNLKSKLNSIKAEYQKEQQNEAKRVSVVLTNYIDGKFRALLDDKDRHDKLDQFVEGLFGVITQIMGNENPDDMEDAKSLLNYSTKGQEKVKDWWTKQGIRIAIVVVPLLTYLIFPSFMIGLKNGLVSLVTTDKSASDLYIKNLKDTKFKKQEFNPKLVKELGNTYVDSVLYTRDYLMISQSNKYQDEWITAFNKYSIEELELPDNTVVDYISKESTLLKDLIKIRKFINPKFLKESRIRMEELENEFITSITEILEGQDNYILIYGYQKDFFDDYIKKNKILLNKEKE